MPPNVACAPSFISPFPGLSLFPSSNFSISRIGFTLSWCPFSVASTAFCKFCLSRSRCSSLGRASQNASTACERGCARLDETMQRRDLVHSTCDSLSRTKLVLAHCLCRKTVIRLSQLAEPGGSCWTGLCPWVRPLSHWVNRPPVSFRMWHVKALRTLAIDPAPKSNCVHLTHWSTEFSLANVVIRYD